MLAEYAKRDKLHQQWESSVATVVDAHPEDFNGEAGHKLIERFTFIFAGVHNRLAPGHRGQFPRFTHGIALRRDSFKAGNAVSTPNHRFEERLKCENRQHVIM